MADDGRLAHGEFDLGRAGRLITREVFHRYPGKRALLHGELGERAVVAKFYLGHWQQFLHWFHSVRGSRALSVRGIATPELLYAGFQPSVPAWLSVQEYIPPDEPWPPRSGDPAFEHAHRRLLETLAHHHEAGVIQRDLNWLNFIPRGGQLYTLDTDEIRVQRRPLSRHRAIGHLVRMYSSKTHLPETVVLSGYHQYGKVRHWSLDDADIRDFLLRVREGRLHHARRVATLAGRGWKHYPREHRGGGLLIRDRRRLNPEHCRELEERLATAGTSGARAFTLGGGRAVCSLPLGTAPRRWRRHLTRRAIGAWRTLVTTQRLGLTRERHLGVIVLPTHDAWTAFLLRSPTEGIPLTTVLDQGDAVERRSLLSALGWFLAALNHSRCIIERRPLEALTWDGRHISLSDPRAARCIPPRRPRFSAQWEPFRRRIIQDLETHGIAATELPQPDAARTPVPSCSHHETSM